MSTFLFIALLFGAYFVAATVLCVFAVACIFWAQERHRRALQATERWRVPATLPEDWSWEDVR